VTTAPHSQRREHAAHPADARSAHRLLPPPPWFCVTDMQLPRALFLYPARATLYHKSNGFMHFVSGE